MPSRQPLCNNSAMRLPAFPTVGLLGLLCTGCSAAPNSVPSISSLSPASLKVGGGAQTLTINGTNFLPASTVTCNGLAHTATIINSGKLTINLTDADLYALGNDPIVVSNPAPGGGSSFPASLQVYGDAQNSTISGSLVPSSSYELDAFDVQGNYAYLLGDDGNQGNGSSAAQLYIVDVTNPAHMTVRSTTSILGAERYGQSGIRAQGHYVYLLSSTGTPATNLLQIYDVSDPTAPALTGSIPLPLYALGLWVSGNFAYVISYVGDPEASVLSIVDISNPASPSITGSTTTGTAGLHVADIKVVGKYAYVSGQSGSPDSEELVFDVSNPAAPILVSSLWVYHSPQGLDVEGNYWYQSVYDAGLLNIYDLSTPSSPTLVGSVPLDSACKPQGVTVEGTTAYVACYESSSIAVVDVTNPTAPVLDGSIALPPPSYPIFLESKGRYVYSISNSPGGALSVIDTGR